MRLNLKGIQRIKKKLRDGTHSTHFYLRGVGAIKPLPGDMNEPFDVGTPAFMRSYFLLIDAPNRARTTGTLQQIINGYKKSPQFTDLAPRTKRDYDLHIAKIEKAVLKPNSPVFATYPLNVIDDPKIRGRILSWRDKMAETSPRQADSTIAVLRVILEWGRDRGMISNNHITRPKKVYKADRSDKLWLPEHLTAFREKASEEMKLALALALWTGQRQTDLLKLTWSNIKDGRLKFRQGKKRRLVDVRLPAGLKAILDATPQRAMTILTDPNGKPWTTEPRPIYFMHCWRKATLAAELDGLHFHDLRGTTCTMLADAGCTPSEIASVLGWTATTVMEMLDRYQAMTAVQSDSAITKLEAMG